MAPLGPPEPPRNCRRCDRLVAFRSANRKDHPDWFNGAVPSFGCEDARLLIVGLAPGLSGANRTGRPFTGDAAGALLYPTLVAFGFASGAYDERVDDGLTLEDCMITNAVRCVPPQNKPVGAETSTCRPFLGSRIAALPRLTTILALGRIAHDNTVRVLGLKLSDVPFAHGASADVGNGIRLYDSYHCSRYNLNTRRLTPEMFHDVFKEIRLMLDGA